MRNGSSVNKRAVEYLVYSGAFDEFGLSKKTLITKYDDVISFVNYGNFIDSKDFVLQNIDEYSYSELNCVVGRGLGLGTSC